MVLSKRERVIAIVAAAAVTVLVLDHYVLTPMMTSTAQLAERREEATAKLGEAKVLFARRTAMERKWDQMLAGGLKTTPDDAEAQVLHALQNWADDARLNLTSRRPERSTQGDVVREISVQTSGTGSMAAVSRFLYLVETAQIPLRISDLQIGARREGTDDLSLVARISTLYLVKSTTPEKTAPAAAPAPAAATEEPS